jgi:hypothetical protein
MMDKVSFITPEVEFNGHTSETGYFYSKAKLRWSMQPHVTNWGIFSWGIQIEEQEIPMTYSVYNEETDEEEEKTVTVKLDPATVDIKMKVNHISSDFMPVKIDMTGKKSVIYFGSDD